MTEDRQKNVDFTDTYITTKQEIIVKDSQVGSSIGIRKSSMTTLSRTIVTCIS